MRPRVKPKCTFGEVLDQFIQQRGMTQEEVATLAGIKQSSVSWFVQCRKLPSMNKPRSKSDGEQSRAVIVRLASALNLTLEEKKKLYRARLIIDNRNPVWDPQIIDTLSKVPSISQDEAVKLFLKGLKGEHIATWANKKGFLDSSVQKIFDFLRGKPGRAMEVASMRKSVLPQVINQLSLTISEKTSLARFFFEKLLDPDIVKTLTSES